MKVNSIFKSFKDSSENDLLEELLKSVFNENQLEKMYHNKISLDWKNLEGESFLHLCSQKNLLESVKWLINKGISLEIENDDKETALFYAAKTNAKEVVKVLIKSGANIQHQNRYKRTALQEAVICDSRDIVDILISNKANVNNVDNYGHNLVFDAVSNGDIEIIRKIANSETININQIDNDGKTILHQKTTLNNDEIANELLEAGADPTINDRDGKNFLFHTAVKGINSEYLIDKAISLGCDINSRSKDNKNILMEVLSAFSKISHKESLRRDSLFKMLKKLIEKGVDVNAYDNEGETSLFITVRQNNLDALMTLLETNNIDTNHKNKNGDSVLSIACMSGIKYLDIILVLLRFGCDSHFKDKNGLLLVEKVIELVLHTQNNKTIDKLFFQQYNIDMEGNYFNILKELLENSEVNLYDLNSEGKPFFFDSIFYKNQYLFKLLRKYGADLNQKDSNHHNILYNVMANAQSKYEFSRKEYLETLEQLIKMRIDVNSRDSHGGVTLHKAILDNCEQTVKLLLNSKIDINAVDIKGRNVIHNCVWKGKVKHFRILIKHNLEVMNQPDKFGVLAINYAAFMGHEDLVLEMISSGSYINNNYSKNKKMLEFLSRFENNLDKLISHTSGDLNKKNISMLVENMRSEFKITK